MEMSPNTSSSALLLHFMCLLLLLTPITQTTDSAPTLAPSLLTSTTLLFDSGAPGSGLRNCSCPDPVQDCDEALANSLCRCHTVVRSALPPAAGLRGPGRLTVWVKELWVLEELLNNSMVGHLHLSFCGIKPMDSQYLALMGLQTLRIHSAVPEASYRDQEISLLPAGGAAAELEALSFDLSSSSHLTILDVAVLNGLSALKAYSVVGPPAPELSQNFPLLATPFSPGEAADPLQKLLITFVY